MNPEPNITPVFPVPILNTQLNVSDGEFLSWENFIKSQEYWVGKSTPITQDQHILDNNIFNNLKNQITKMSIYYLNNIGYKIDSVKITSSWGVKTINERDSSTHDHSNSFISGVFYFNKGSNIMFSNPNTSKWWLKSLPIQEESIDIFKWTSFSFKPCPKLLIMFPSWLFHKIESKNENEKRFSIAFNIIPKGYFGGAGSKINL